jgi:hypothetical protein
VRISSPARSMAGRFGPCAVLVVAGSGGQAEVELADEVASESGGARRCRRCGAALRSASAPTTRAARGAGPSR